MCGNDVIGYFDPENGLIKNSPKITIWDFDFVYTGIR